MAENRTLEDVAARREYWRLQAVLYRSTAEGRESARRAASTYDKTDKGKASRKRSAQKRSQQIKSYQKKYRKAHGDDPDFLADAKARSEKYKRSDKGRAWERAYGIANREWLRFASQLRSTSKGRPQLTLDEYHALCEAQDFLCAVCGVETFPLHVDHCHAVGHVRGLLCNRCNNGLGKFKDDPSLLRAAALYIERDRAI